MTQANRFPKLLVISNQCFSHSTSNGRTMGNFFVGWPKDRLAQFCLSMKDPNWDVCDRYFCVTDAQALAAFKSGRCAGGTIDAAATKSESAAPSTGGKGIARNALTMLERNMVWRLGRWKKCGFDAWVRDFAPDVVLLQAGDMAYTFQLARRVALKQKAKLVIYNSEAYYFKDFDYFRGRGLAKLLYPIFRMDFRHCLRKTYALTSHIFYACDALTIDYGKEFSVPSETIYTASATPEAPIKADDGTFTAAYCGNLGLDRYKALIEVAEALQSISEDLYLDVYGKAPSEAAAQALNNCPGLRFHGFVSYAEVQNVIANSDLVLHAESFDAFYREDLKYAFSTKIADQISSGKCFLLYAPETLACSRYLIENEAAYVVTQKDKLRETLAGIVQDPSARTKYRTRALELAKQNHCGTKSVSRFQSVICELSERDNHP